MKTFPFFSLLCMVIVLCSCSGQSRTTLNISVSGCHDSLFMFMAPHAMFSDTVTFNPEESVKITFDNTEISSVLLIYAGTYTRLFIEPNREYTVLLDFTNEGKLNFQIDDEALQAYHTLSQPRDIYKYESIKDYSAAPLDTVGSVLLRNFVELAEQEVNRLNALEMSDNLRSVLKTDTELYWMTSASKVIRNDYFKSEQTGKSMYPGYKETWKTIYQHYPVNESIIESTYFYPYLQTYFRQASCESGISPQFNFSYAEYVDSEYKQIEDYIEDEKVKEALLVQKLAHDCLNNTANDKALIRPIEKFTAAYPENINVNYFRDYVAGLEEYYLLIAQDFDSEVKFVEEYENLHTLKDVISIFKGKPLFIDFWFSTCGPCIREFKHNDALKEFLKENDIEMVYISIDRPQSEENWINKIKAHNLTGYHIRASQALHEDMYHNYNIYSFPHYMLIDSNGNVVINRAEKQPSDGDKLFEEISAALP